MRFGCNGLDQRGYNPETIAYQESVYMRFLKF